MAHGFDEFDHVAVQGTTVAARNQPLAVHVREFSRWGAESAWLGAHRTARSSEQPRGCGGCPYLAGSQSDEQRDKQQALETALSRERLAFSPSSVVWDDAPVRLGYRNRIRLRITKEGGVRFFNEHKSPSCPVLEPALRSAVERLAAMADRRPGALACFHHVELRAPDARGRFGAYFVLCDSDGRPWVPGRRRAGASPSKPEEDASCWTLPSDAIAALSDLGPDWLVRIEPPDAPAGRVASDSVRRSAPNGGEAPCQHFVLGRHGPVEVPVGEFMQVNSGVNHRLVDYVVNQARAARCVTFADLFAGSGNFALPLGRAGLEGVAVETVPASVEALARVARGEGLRVEPICERVARQLERWSTSGQIFDMVIIDGPRAGLKDGHERVATLARKTIVVCSCNPNTFAKDVALFAELGWSVSSLRLFDMFPGTRHLEVVATLVCL